MITIDDVNTIYQFRNKYYPDPEPYWCDEEFRIRVMEQYAINTVIDDLYDHMSSEESTADGIIFDHWCYCIECRDDPMSKPNTIIFYRYSASALNHLMQYLFDKHCESDPFYWYDMQAYNDDIGYDDYFIYDRINKKND